MLCMQIFALVLRSLSKPCLNRKSQDGALRKPMPVSRLHASIWSRQLALCADHWEQPQMILRLRHTHT